MVVLLTVVVDQVAKKEHGEDVAALERDSPLVHARLPCYLTDRIPLNDLVKHRCLQLAGEHVVLEAGKDEYKRLPTSTPPAFVGLAVLLLLLSDEL